MNQEITKLFSGSIRRAMEDSLIEMEHLYEMRLRIHEPLILIYRGKEYFLTEKGKVSQIESGAYFVTSDDIRETLEYVSDYSMYAFEEEIRQGFLTIPGGHRIGLSGKVVLEGNQVKTIKYISSLNFRFSHQIKGCASLVLPYLIKQQNLCHTLIISPPRGGKTTMLRDLIRQISNGAPGRMGLTVGVVDERSELGGSYLGVPQNDLGRRTDILDCCPKAEGMMLLIRSMSPDVVAVDELGNDEEIRAMEAVCSCGCKLLATVHGNSMEDLKRKPLLKKWIQEGIFERYVILGKKEGSGRVRQILDEKGIILYNGDQKREWLC